MDGPSQDFGELQKRIVAFRDARDWKQFHNPKDRQFNGKSIKTFPRGNTHPFAQ